MKIGYDYVEASHVPSLLLWVGLQFVASGVLTIAIYSICSQKIVLPRKENWKGVALVFVLQTVLQYSLLYIGLSFTTSVKGAILKSTDVFMVALIASLVFKLEKLTTKKLISCVIGFLGIVVMNLDGLRLNFHPVGDGSILIGMLAYSFSVIMTKLYAQKEDPIVLCGYQMSLGGGVVLLIGLLCNGKLDFAGLLPVFLCLSLIYAVAYTLWTILLKYNPAFSVTIYSFMVPVFGVLFTPLLLNENSGVATPNLIFALVLVCIGIVLWGYEKKAVWGKR